ncbi:hypothetical protein [Nereida sp. MMG025]|uniref:hypothetical protein n=1 Tax=Nereida sp. MMG025 TaxID=2909981 RepID=UPI001F3EE330|nr:hypothetical protein [Nereida sp. MMG025]MCF6443617.1 hypothetical protein [Nereida sp. MMG025]
MRFFRCLILAGLTSPSLLLADTIADAKQVFAAWQPTSITLTETGVLRVVLPQRRITDTIYYASIQTGFCFGPLFGQPMKDATSVFVLNESETQGWLFEGSTTDCSDINDAPSSRSKLLIAAKSSTHTNSSEGL